MTLLESQNAVGVLATQLSEQRTRLARAESDLPRLQAQHASLALAQDIDGAANGDALAANEEATAVAASTVQRAQAAIAELTRRLSPAQESLARLVHEENLAQLSRLDEGGANLFLEYESATREVVKVGTDLAALSRAREQLANGCRQFAMARRLALPGVWRYTPYELGMNAITGGCERFDAWLAGDNERRMSDAPLEIRR
jgi:chromosome segregation ATPase